LKILVYGAGVIGSLLTHNLCVAGNDVSLLARGEWADCHSYKIFCNLFKKCSDALEKT
jgi:ketopantoate reductase